MLIGQVTLGAGSSVWPNATLRGDDAPIVVGAQSSIQDGSTIHATEGQSRTTVGDRVTVGHNVILHGCTIGDDCLIGMGSIVLDSAIVEPGAFIGAGTLVMGNPFKLVRVCTQADRDWIEHSWRAYVRRGQEYLAQAPSR